MEEQIMKKMVALLAGAMIMMATSAMALPLSITFSQSGYLDQTVIDTNNDGKITLNGFSFGDFAIDFIGGTSSLPNDPTKNKLSVNSFTLTNTAGSDKMITVSISDDDFALNPVYPTTFNAQSVFGASGLSTEGTSIATFSAYLDTTNALFGTGTSLGTWGPLGLTGASSTMFTPLTLTGAPFSLTETISITQGSGSSANFNANVELAPVPEPGTIVLLGAGLLGLGAYSRRRMKK
jgi:hypothetical protein